MTQEIVDAQGGDGSFKVVLVALAVAAVVVLLIIAFGSGSTGATTSTQSYASSNSGDGYMWLVWLIAGAISVVMILAQIRLFFIDAKLQTVIDRMDSVVAELRKTRAIDEKKSVTQSSAVVG